MAPRLEFSPPLSSTTHVPLTHEVSTSIPIHLQVRLSRAWYDKLREAGRQIQVWSDTHVGRRGERLWKETPFVFPADPNVQASPVSAESSTISLLPHVPEAVLDVHLEETKDVALIATLSVPNSQGRYAFTFRIAGPYSQIEWLGNMGSNGTIMIGRGGDRVGFVSTVLNKSAWSPAEGKWIGDAREGNLVEIGRLNNVEMRGWAFGNEGQKTRVTGSEQITSNLFLLSATRPASSISGDAPLLLIIASRSPVTLTYSGTILVAPTSEPSPVYVTELGPSRSFEEIKTLVTRATNGAFELVSGSPQTSGFLVLKSRARNNMRCTGRVHVVPRSLIQTSTSSRISLPLESLLLDTLLPSPRIHILYSPANGNIVVVEEDQIHSTQCGFHLVTGAEGGEMLVLPSIPVNEDGEECSWQLAVVGSKVTEVTRETIAAVESVAPAPVSDNQHLPPAANGGGVPPSFELLTPAQSDPPIVSSGEGHEHVDLGASDTEDAPTQGEGEAHTPTMVEKQSEVAATSVPSASTEPSRSINPVIIRSHTTSFLSSFRPSIVSRLLTWWLRLFGVLRFVLMLLPGHRPRIPAGHKENSAEQSVSGNELQASASSRETSKGPVETKPAKIVEETLLDVQPSSGDKAPEQKPVFQTSAKGIVKNIPLEEHFPSDKEARTPATMILTPPMTPPISTVGIVSPLSESSPPERRLRLVLSSDRTHDSQTPSTKVIAYKKGAVSLPNSWNLSIDGEEISRDDMERKKGSGSQPVWWSVDRLHSEDQDQRHVVLVVAGGL